MGLEKRTCESCIYLDKEKTASLGVGYCRRYPPSPDGWAQVQFKWWCGEHRDTSPELAPLEVKVETSERPEHDESRDYGKNLDGTKSQTNSYGVLKPKGKK